MGLGFSRWVCDDLSEEARATIDVGWWMLGVRLVERLPLFLDKRLYCNNPPRQRILLLQALKLGRAVEIAPI